jgi:hypothetical protein
MQERRSFPRKYLMFYSRVFNLKTGELVGHIVEITPTGAMLISETPLEANVNYHLKMELPDELSTKQFLTFEARSVWCDHDIIPAFYDIGFQLLNVPQSDIDLIQRLIDAFGFREH